MSMTLSALDGYAPLVVALSTALLAWAWSETFARIREAEAGLSRWPRFTTFALMGASAFALSGIILLSQFLGPAARELRTEHQPVIYALVLFPSIGLLLIALLARLDRRYHWTRLLVDRNRGRIETAISEEGKELLAETISAELDPAIKALETIIHEVQRQKPMDRDSVIALASIEKEVARMTRLRHLTDNYSHKGPDRPGDLQRACDETLRRLRTTQDKHAELQFFGTDGLHPNLPSHHLNTLVWNLARIALLTADDDEPVVEMLFREEGQRLVIEAQTNGVGVEVLHEGPAAALEECHLVASMYGGTLLPEGPPFGNQLCVVLHDALEQKTGTTLTA